MHGVTDHRIRVRRVELRNHGGCLLQDTFGVSQVVTRQFIGVDADRLGHIGGKRCKVPVTFNKGFTCRALEGSSDVDEDLFCSSMLRSPIFLICSSISISL